MFMSNPTSLLTFFQGYAQTSRRDGVLFSGGCMGQRNVRRRSRNVEKMSAESNHAADVYRDLATTPQITQGIPHGISRGFYTADTPIACFGPLGYPRALQRHQYLYR